MPVAIARPVAWIPACLLAAACGEVPILTELAPEQTCRRTILVGPVGVPVEIAEAESPQAREPDPSGAAPTGGNGGDGDVASAPEGVGEGADEADAADAAETVQARPELEWKVPRSDAHRHQLNAWCAAVGPAVFGGWADPPVDSVETVHVVSWNVHVGGGDLRRLVSDLREGVLTGGEPVRHFVLLLQEAFREDDTVPAFDPGLPVAGGVYLAPPTGERTDIIEDARSLGLSVLYAPSMRNGEGDGDESPEDRGNAILSTLPLSDPIAIELPVARQRRVAVAAMVALGPSLERGGDVDTDGEEDGDGEDGARRLLVASVHLENDAAGWARDEAARLEQTEALLEGLPDHEAAVAAGDYNTWARAQEEALVGAMLRAFPDTPPFPAGNTYVRAYGLVRRYLDYVFVRLPDEGRAEVIRVPDPYASDHFPLVARIEL